MAAFDLTGTASPRARLGALFKSGSNYSALRDELKASFTAGACSDVAFRKAQLRALVNCLTENVDEASAAIAADMGRPKGEAQGEVMATVREANDVIAKLDKWAKPERVSAHFMMQPSHAAIRRSPYGVVLVLGPYNYPLMLLLEPVIGAIAAGNVVVCKPSELTPATADFIARQLPKYVSAEVCRVVTGSADVSAALTATQWDFIYFTGSPRVGKLVAKAAAEYMTPHVLELGGKAPVVVHSSANLREAARRIINTKALNCGQTCVAPDYILVDASVHEQFLQLLKSQIAEQMGAEPSVSPDYGRMCTVGHFDRMEKLIKESGGTHHRIGNAPADRATKFMPLTLIDEPDGAAPVLHEEIFGPILPIVPFKNFDDAISLIRSTDATPLALYIFTGDEAPAETLMAKVQSGSVVVNDCVFQHLCHSLPFGGVGSSGYGVNHGRFSWETFTYPRAVLWRHATFDVDQTVPFPVRHASAKSNPAIRPWTLKMLILYAPYMTWPTLSEVFIGLLAMVAAFAAYQWSTA